MCDGTENKKLEIITFSGEKLRKKLYKLVDIGMIHIETDVINLTGELYLFETPIGAN